MSQDGSGIRREDLNGTFAMEQNERIPSTKRDERGKQALEWGLESAASIRDRKIPLFNRSRRGYHHGGQFLDAPFLTDMRELGGQDLAFMGVPLDCGTTNRPGTRYGPQALRRSSGHGYNPEIGVDLGASLDMIDVGDVTVIPANIEKSFDQIALGIGYLHERGVFPVVLGGDHSIGYPDIRGIAPYIDGNVGIIHFDRHSDLAEYSLDERMHGSPFFHATNIPNAPATNLVQIGIGGFTGMYDGLRVARDRRATVITLDDVDRYGVERVAEYALEIAWKDAKAVFLSFDIDSVDPAFAPGTGTPEPGGFLPREVLRLLRLVTREGLIGMELVEVSPPYDVSDITALLGARVIKEVLATLVLNGKLGQAPSGAAEEEPAQPSQLHP
ncbi:MAG TPA: agmatinase family protein [Nitrolancea sp.]|nr:agmatinase family protein [Nitrolancea sp.]